MINRPPTRIELKLEDDFIEYEEMNESRAKNPNVRDNVVFSPNNTELYQLTPNYYDANNLEFSPFNDHIRQNIMMSIKKNSEDQSVSKSNISDVHMI